MNAEGTFLPLGIMSGIINSFMDSSDCLTAELSEKESKGPGFGGFRFRFLNGCQKCLHELYHFLH